MSKTRIASLFSLVTIAVGACTTHDPSPDRSPPVGTSAQALVSYSGTIGELAAALIFSLPKDVTSQQARDGINGAKVITGAEAIPLIIRPHDDAKAMLQQPGAKAVVVQLTADKKFLYVPYAAAGKSGVGFVIDAEDDPKCHQLYCESNGQEGPGQHCVCTETCRTANSCTDVGGNYCTECSHDPYGDWTQDDLWTDPMPDQFKKVQTIFGDDGRFACKATANEMGAGGKLFDACTAPK